MKLIPDPANQLAPHNKSNWLWTAEGLCWSPAEAIFHTILCLSIQSLCLERPEGEKNDSFFVSGKEGR